MHAITDRATGQRHPRLLRPAIIVACVLIGLAIGLAARADTPPGRRPGAPLVEPMTVSAADRAATRARVGEIARGLRIPGRAGSPRRTFHALDLGIVDETDVADHRGRIVAVIRTDGATGALRSVVRLDWTTDADDPRVDRSGAAAHARRHARLAGLVAPAGHPSVRWDDAMDAWRVDWVRRIDGLAVTGDGLTVWVHRGGQLAAMTRSETASSAPPLERIAPAAAAAAARAWADRHGVPTKDLSVVVDTELTWVRPNDFLTRGGAQDTDLLLHLAYRVDLAIPMTGSSRHRIAIFVDAGSGALLAGVETA
ncbi:MAG: hypothetical protein ABWY52_03630 [Candidatus Limnocylindrales bacterium]